jgi:hypothetical protein
MTPTPGRFTQALHQARRREHPLDLSKVIQPGISVEEMKKSPHYAGAKAGSREEALALMDDILTGEFVSVLRAAFRPGTVFVFPHAAEAGGKNAIPGVFASLCAEVTGGGVQHVTQTNRTFHTGASMMERLANGAEFDEEIELGRNYALVDDNLTSGGTLSDLGSYITSLGGNIVGVVVLTSSQRSGTVSNRKKLLDIVERRFGDVVQEELGIHPQALTDNELSYLAGFRSADELRGRVAAAGRSRADRLRSKGLGGLGTQEVAPPHQEGTK